MRLLSATVRNYRIHREVHVEFSDSLTLIGGRNETGKSTLAEAIHRGLFLKATTGGKTLEGMQSSLHNGHPEVEVRFEADGKRWELKKLFNKGSGKTSLAEEGGTTLHGSDAEARVAELMQIEEPASGASASKKAMGQWAHLWVWQGSGGEDPSEQAADQRDALLSRLKEQGGGAVMQSDLDGRIASRFQSEYEEIFTKSGQPKAGSNLFVASREKEEAEQELEDARATFRRLRSAVSDFEEAETVLASGEKRIAEIKSQLEAARAGSRQATELQHRIDLEQRNRDEADRERKSFTTALEEVEILGKKLEAIVSRAEPEREKLEAGEERRKQAAAAVTRAEKEAGSIEKSLAQLREKKELAEAWGHFLKNRNRLKELERDLTRVEAREKEHTGLLEKLAALPAVDDPAFQHLQALEVSTSEARAVLEALSTGIEILHTDTPVKIGEKSLETGAETVIHEEASLSIGENIALRISPGGGTSLRRARAEAAEREAARETALRELGIGSLEEARRIRDQRLSLDEKRRAVESALSSGDPAALREEKEEARREVIRYEAEIERRSERVSDFVPPASFAEAKALWESCRDQLEPVEEQLRLSRQEISGARAVAESAALEWDRARKSIAESERERVEVSTLLQAKEEPLGDPGNREEKKTSLESRFNDSSRKLNELREQRAALSPETIEAGIQRFGRALERQNEELETAGQKRAVARSILSRDGTHDPAAALARAKAAIESATERHRSLFRRAEAIRLLRDRFAEEQQKLSDQFSRPLAGKVTGYLRQIFGPAAKASVSVENGVIGGWQMTRDHGTFDFADLSGGTREQVAAAVRLAIAEILAEDHGGCLPVVFDDAFTHSDPARIESLQSMLDLASCNGLQIILLTCTPEDYAGLGAKSVPLHQSGTVE